VLGKGRVDALLIMLWLREKVEEMWALDSRREIV
jgi:hypothetical protein